MKSIICMLLIVFLPHNVYSQLNAGIKAGFNNSTFQWQFSGFRQNVEVGVFLNVPVNRLIFSIEANRVKRGGILKDQIHALFGLNGSDTYASKVDIHSEFDFIEIPVVIRYPHIFNSEYTLNPYIGYSFSMENYLIDYKDRENTELKNRREYEKYPENEVDIIGVFGGGPSFDYVHGMLLGFLLQYKKISIDLRYYHGISELYPGSTTSKTDLKYNGISILIGVVVF